MQLFMIVDNKILNLQFVTCVELNIKHGIIDADYPYIINMVDLREPIKAKKINYEHDFGSALEALQYEHNLEESEEITDEN